MMDDETPETPKEDKPNGHDVGYGKAPAGSRFTKGQSGNPSGKRKGTLNKLPAMNEERLKTIILEEAYRTIKINDGDKQVTVPMVQAIVRSLAVAAVKGQLHAQALFVRLLSVVEQENKELHNKWVDAALDYKIKWEKELQRRKQLGITLPDPVPHPDSLLVDVSKGTVTIAGPMTQKEKDLLDKYQKQADEEGRDLLEILLEARDRDGGGSR